MKEYIITDEQIKTIGDITRNQRIMDILRSRPAPDAAGMPESVLNKYLLEAYDRGAKDGREKVLDILREWSIAQYEISGVIDTMELKQKIESLRREEVRE